MTGRGALFVEPVFINEQREEIAQKESVWLTVWRLRWGAMSWKLSPAKKFVKCIVVLVEPLLVHASVHEKTSTNTEGEA